MFLPNTDSFLLTRQIVVKPRFPVFLPNTDSFLLVVRKSTVQSSFVREEGKVASTTPKSMDGIYRPPPQSVDKQQYEVSDSNKRNFLKVAGIAGAGLIASQLSPKRAQALIMGSSPTTGVVGVKDADNDRINPATEVVYVKFEELGEKIDHLCLYR